MPETTPNLGIKKPTGNEVVTRQSFNENWDIIDQNAAKKADLDTHLTNDSPHPVLGERISVLESHHANQNMQSITLSHGIQKIATDQATPFVPKFEGRTLVNLLGRDGKCEDLSKWYTSSESATLSLTTDKAIVGDNAIKLTLIRNDIDYGIAAYDVTNIIDKSKYYFLCGYIANGTTNIVRLTMRNTDGVDVISPSVTSCDMTYVGVKCSPLELSNSTNNQIYITGNSANDQYAYLDAIALYEIDQATYYKIDVDPEYTGAKLADKFPYVDDVKHLQNPGLKKWGKNLLPPFNEWWSEDESKTEITSPYEVKLTTTEATGYLMSKIIPALPNTTYTLSCTITGGGDSRIVVGERIVSGGEVKLYRTLINTDSSTTFTTSSDTVEFYVYVTNNSSAGTFTFTNPQLELGSTATEFEPYNEDYLYLETTLAEGETLDYIDGDWMRTKKWETEVVLDGSLDWEVKEKYVGYKRVQVPNYLTYQHSDLNCIKYNGSILTNEDTEDGSDIVSIQEGSLHITIPDTDSGWGENYTPTSDEVKAYFWGWTMCDENGATPYGNENRYWKLAGHEPVVLWSDTANSSPPDRSAALDAYDWEHQHYKLNYQLAEPATKLVPYEGGIGLHAGYNQIDVFAGVIVRELVKPQIDGDYYYINRSDYDAGSGKLNYPTNRVITAYKNNLEDLSWRFATSVDNSYGGGYAYIHKDNFDPTATYTVTYIASPQEFTTSCLEVTGEHSTNLKTVVNELVENMADVSSDVSVVQNSVTAHLAETVQKTDKTINVPTDYSTVQEALDSLKYTWIPSDVTVTIQIAEGTYTYDSTITVNHPCGNQIQIVGATPVTTDITGVDNDNITGSAGVWIIPINVESVEGINVGEYVIIKDTEGESKDEYDHVAHRGIWEITAVGEGQITVTNTHRQSEFPTATVNSGTAVVLKTILKFNNCYGVIIEDNNALGMLNAVALVGDGSLYYGLAVGRMQNDYGKSSPALVLLGNNFGVNGFGGAGIYAGVGGTIYAVDTASSGNGNNGYCARSNSIFAVSSSTSSGNGKNGFYAERGATITTAPSTSSGNGGCGYYADMGASIYAGSSTSSSNSDGVDYCAYRGSTIYCGNCKGGTELSPAANEQGNLNSIIVTV